MQLPIRMTHRLIGDCDLVRIEGTTWIIRSLFSAVEYRFPATRRNEFKLHADSISRATVDKTPALEPSASLRKSPADGLESLENTISDEDIDLAVPSRHAAERDNRSTDDDRFASGHANDTLRPPDVGPNASLTTADDLNEAHPRLLRRILRSLEDGLSPNLHHIKRLAVGNESICNDLQRLLQETDGKGGSALIVRGGYGQGKTFTLRILEDLAHDAGFMTARTEIDASEIKLDKPHHVYGSLMSTIRIPGTDSEGARALAKAAAQFIRSSAPQPGVMATREWLRCELGCRPLAWLLSDPRLPEKEPLLRLLGAEPGPIAMFRAAHVTKAQARDWPAFSAGTQGDVASYLLSGIGRLARLMGHKGLVILMDEMEKWQDLPWVAQSRAGNFLGGLIWSATAQPGHRYCRSNVEVRLGSEQGRSSFTCDHDFSLKHSGRCGGYPFTTSGRCHLGLAIALTPRGSEGPESIWKKHGTLRIADLPTFDVDCVRRYFDRICPIYKRAHSLTCDIPNAVLVQASVRWRESGDRGSRSAVTAILGALKDWKDGGR